jgi:peptidoglycan hydrolase CwlO-like protein
LQKKKEELEYELDSIEKSIRKLTNKAKDSGPTY